MAEKKSGEEEELKIKAVSCLLSPTRLGGRVVSYKQHCLDPNPGHFTSILFSIRVVIEEDEEQREVQLFAKIPPIFNDHYWEQSLADLRVIPEHCFYKVVVPALEKLQLEAGIPREQIFDGFLKYIGSRFSLDMESMKVDRDAVIVFEDVVQVGYLPFARISEYNNIHTNLILNYMGKFHALVIGLRRKREKFFKEEVLPYFKNVSLLTLTPTEVNALNLKENLEAVGEITGDDENALRRIKELYKNFESSLAKTEVKETMYTTLAHINLWWKNFVFASDGKGITSKLKFFDFQTTQYVSLVHDVLFFTLLNVDSTLLRRDFRDLMRIYYDAFIRCLQSLDITTEDDYSFADFWVELRRVAPLELYHIINMVKFVFADIQQLLTYDETRPARVNFASHYEAIVTRIGVIVEVAQKYEFFY